MATFALAQDNAFGQPLESQLRSCLLASSICDGLDAGDQLRDTVYWVSLLRYIGCTGHAHEVATVFGDEIAIRAQTLVHDAGNPAEVMRDVLAFATAAHPPEEREQVTRVIQEGAHDWAVLNFASGCEVGDMLLDRLSFGPDVRDALAFTFERWNGTGFPAGAAGEEIPLAMRIVHLSHDMEAIGRLFSPADAIRAAGDRGGRTYDPSLAELFVVHGPEWFAALAKLEPWDAVLDLEPRPTACSTGPLSTTRSPSPPTSSTSSRRSWEGTVGAAPNSPELPPGRWGSPMPTSSPSVGRLSCTISAPPRCPTRSGTSRAR